jgi:catechol 1,2-dioxygenase
LTATPERSAARRGFIRTLITSAAAGSAAAAHASACRVTGGDILGPFHRPNAAFGEPGLIELARAGEPGQRIVLAGRVLRPDCRTPVAGAVVDAWQANEQGQYDVKAPDEVIAPANYNLRGQTRTNERGEFTLQTILPGKYRIPPGLENFERFAGYLRPAHIHLSVTHPVYLPLTTQLYFSGDPQIGRDPWARHSRNLVQLRGDRGRFDIVLGNTPPRA